MFFGVTLLVVGRGVVGWDRKSYVGPAEISYFSCRNLSRRNKHESSWLVVSTGYFYILFLWAIIVSDFPHLEIHKHLVLHKSSITFTANSQADNHFYMYIYLLKILIHVNLFLYYRKKNFFSINRFFCRPFAHLNQTLKVRKCRFENLPLFSNSLRSNGKNLIYFLKQLSN